MGSSLLRLLLLLSAAESKALLVAVPRLRWRLPFFSRPEKIAVGPTRSQLNAMWAAHKHNTYTTAHMQGMHTQASKPQTNEEHIRDRTVLLSLLAGMMP